MTVTEIAPAPSRASKLTRLLNTCPSIGGVYSLTFDDAIVLTNDRAKHEHGGIPRGGWLLAAACKGDEADWSLDDEEVVLLRVREVTPLPNERELTSGRLGVIRDAQDRRENYDDVADAYTRAEHQQSALACDVVGVFYTNVENSEHIEFGAELDNVWSSAHYRVFLPSPKSLSWIASFPRSSAMVDIGNVRFSATRRNAQRHGRDQARVAVNVEDFIGAKTAVFGLTRSGKSNTIKTLTTAVYRYAAEREQRVGQVIFDPQGEYANVNQQDGTGLRNLGDPDSDHVRIYTATPRKDDKQKHPMRLNFFDIDLFDVAWDMVVGSMEGAEANYVRSFRSADMEAPEPGNYRAKTHYDRGFMAFYGLLSRAKYKGNFANSGSVSFSIKDPAALAYNKFAAAKGWPTINGSSGVYVCASPEACEGVVDFINMKLALLEKLRREEEKRGPSRRDGDEAPEQGEDTIEDLEENYGKWLESDQFVAVADVFKYAKGRGLAGLRELREFHDPHGRGEIAEMVWDDMRNGRLVIVDLSIGSDTVTKVMSERLVTGLVNRASERFRNNQDPVPFQVIVEEAHNLFERGRDVKDDPWVRMSKEAAKYRIGLVYATQEVTSVDQKILSNTHNWVVAHLNSANETRELSKYYNFEDFTDSIRRAEDKGYVRLKTASSPFIVPVQILKFDHSMINGARWAAGLSPLAGNDGEITAAGSATSSEVEFDEPAPKPPTPIKKATAPAKKTTAPKAAPAAKAPVKVAAQTTAVPTPVPASAPVQAVAQAAPRPRLSGLGDGEF